MILHDVIGRSPLWQVHMLGRPSIQSLRDGIRAERNETKLFFLNTRPGTKKKKNRTLVGCWSGIGINKEMEKKTCEKTHLILLT